MNDGFQSSFELTVYITVEEQLMMYTPDYVSKLFRAYELYNASKIKYIWPI